MAALDQEIVELKKEINGYLAVLNNAATSSSDKIDLRRLITSRTETLNRLMDQQSRGILLRYPLFCYSVDFYLIALILYVRNFHCVFIVMKVLDIVLTK